MLCYYLNVQFQGQRVNDVSGQPISPIFKGRETKRKMEPTGCTATSLRNYHFSLRNNPEERSSRKLIAPRM